MIHFVSIETAILIHDILIESYGGLAGIREYGLLISALEIPKATFEGKDLHLTLYDKAAAYLFHIIKNHPFIDGNKRTGAAIALTFLEMNNAKIKMCMRDFEDLVVATAEGAVSKHQISLFMQPETDD